MSQPPHDVDTPKPEPDAVAAVETGAASAAQKAKAERAARLASALRDNLRRRKAPRPDGPPKVRN